MAETLQFAAPAVASSSAIVSFGFKANRLVIVNTGAVISFVDLTTTSGMVASTSAGYQVTPGTSGILRLDAPRGSGWPGLSALSTGAALLSIGAWKV